MPRRPPPVPAARRWPRCTPTDGKCRPRRVCCRPTRARPGESRLEEGREDDEVAVPARLERERVAREQVQQVVLVHPRLPSAALAVLVVLVRVRREGAHLERAARGGVGVGERCGCAGVVCAVDERRHPRRAQNERAR